MSYCRPIIRNLKTNPMKKIIIAVFLSLFFSFSHSCFATVLGAPYACVGDIAYYIDSAGVPGGTWSSSNTTVATINAATGIATAHAAGTTTISYTTASSTGTLLLTVNNFPTPITGGPTTFCAGTSATFSDAVAGGTWSSGNTAIATVGVSTGVVTGVSNGVVFIYYNMGGCGQFITVTVNATTPDTATGPSGVCPGSTITLSAIAASGTWSSSNTAVATVDAGTGVVTGVTTGTAAISYTITGPCGPGSSYRIIAVSTTTDAGMVMGSATVPRGATTTLSGSISGGAWSSGNPAIATISGSGTVTGVAVGTCVISYGVTGCSGVAYATKTVSVTPATAVASVSSAVSDISTFPNPTNGKLNINWNATATVLANVTISDITGRLIYNTIISVNKGARDAMIDLSGLNSGLYMMSIKSESLNYNNKIQIQK